MGMWWRKTPEPVREPGAEERRLLLVLQAGVATVDEMLQRAGNNAYTPLHDDLLDLRTILSQGEVQSRVSA